MSDDNPYVIPEMEPTMRKQIQECNWQVVNVTTPANYFHVLRRQIHREFRKPLIVMSPKNLLRHKECKSNLSEFDDVQGHPGFDKQGTRFKRLIKDQNDHSNLEEGISRLVLCSGKRTGPFLKLHLVPVLCITSNWKIPHIKQSHRIRDVPGLELCYWMGSVCLVLQLLLLPQVYYELDEERRKVGRKDVAICRVEQLCPFPYDLIQRELKRYPSMIFDTCLHFIKSCIILHILLTRKIQNCHHYPVKYWDEYHLFNDKKAHGLLQLRRRNSLVELTYRKGPHGTNRSALHRTHICTVFVVFVSDAEIVWCQEEPMNMGAYSYISPRLCTAMKALGRGDIDDIKYVGRAPSAATATGFLQVHIKEQTELVQKALQREPIHYPN
ncbi:hypothetical protein M9H77_28643 [Catharanthus roseus]|uniref:Uncharacterized protein n=1 Tax=Catharanthus roseus TaxID=4058 RepID=A0ACC0AHJ8_CATRO|nr:hypothetical protein M9H77_28643 [Catharanthus roseus]